MPTRQPDAYSIHSPDGLTHECPEPSDQGSEDSDRSKLGDELIDPNVKEDTMKKLTDVMAGINKSIELLMKRVDQIDDKGGAKGGATDALQAINSKDVDKPTKYDGTQWVAWSADFVAFLERRDRRWGKLLKEIEKHSIDPLTTDKKRLIALELDIAKGTLTEDFTNQLYEYLKNFTTGETLSRVTSGGKANSWEAWRIMSDQGKSRRKLEMHEEYRRLMSPAPSTLENLLKSVAQWERDLVAYTAANDDAGISEDMKKLILENMCPEALQEHLADKLEQGLISSYDQYKQVISTYVYRKTRKGKASNKKLHSLHAEESPAEDDAGPCPPCSDEDASWEQQIATLMQQADEINGKLNALVKGKFDKAKGPGKGGSGKANQYGPAPMQVDHTQKDCYHCGELGHIAANCPKQKGGKEGKDGKGGGKGPGKGGGKFGKGGKATGKGGKGGWPPSLQNWRQWYPGPSPSQWTGWWKQAQSNNFKGTANLFEQGNRLSQLQQPQQQGWEQNGWQDGGAWPAPSTPSALQALFMGGSMYKLVDKGPKPKQVNRSTRPVESPNKFQVLQEDDGEEATNETERITTTVPITSLIKPESRNRQRKKARACPDTSADPLASLSPTCTSTGWKGRPGYRKVPDDAFDASRHQTGVRGGMGLPADEAHTAETPDEKGSYWSFNANTNILDFVKQRHRGDVIPRQGLRALRQVQKPEKLAPLTERERPKAPNGWEVLSAVVDSGATITAVHPKDGKAYKVQESAASKAGVTYGTAGGDDLPDLGEKSMAVLTVEGTLRGFRSQVAEVSEPLESVRQLLKSRHCVLFGLGENEDEHLIINKITGEVNRLRDDGINYLHDMLVVPPEQVEAVQQAINNGDSPFGGQGNGR